MEGVTGIADNMVIAGRDEMEHDRNFLAFMEKCMSNNLTLNSEKMSKGTETHSQILPISAFQSCVQKGNRHSSCRCTQSCDPHGSRRQHPVANHSSQYDHHMDSTECRIPG